MGNLMSPESIENAHRMLIDDFYSAFQRRDAAKMAASYHRGATFRDPVFELSGAKIGKMWTMLCARGKDLRIEYTNVSADADRGGADWQAWYLFKATGRPVHNVIRAQFAFKEGLIAEHVDQFGFWRWSAQALGPVGSLLGWTPLLHAKVRRQALRALEDFGG
jgi:hypothetical protein